MTDEPRFTVIGESPWSVIDERNGLVADFEYASDAVLYCQWRNGLLAAPTPKFKVGDLVITAKGPAAVSTFGAWVRLTPNSEGFYVQSPLRLAPPEPRATVHGADSHGNVLITCDGTEKCVQSKELADYIAAGLNEHEDWSL